MVLADCARLQAMRQSLLPRPRLLQRLADASAARITLIQAPAGYGKSGLLQQWHAALRRGGAAAVLLQQAHGRPELSELSRAAAALLKLAGSPLCAAAHGIGAIDGLTGQAVAARILEASAAAAHPHYLLVDDADRMSTGETGLCLRALIADAPEQLHVILASRGTPELQLPRWRACGRLAEIGARALRFTRDETRDFFALAGLTELDPEVLDRFHMRSEGWGVALRLAAQAIAQGREAAEVLDGFSGARRDVREFFAEEVFAGLDPALRDFLLSAAILEEFCAPLCDATAGRDGSDEMLARCDTAGLFLEPLDDTGTWFRFQRLFRDFLLHAAIRSNHGRQELHERASAWLLDAGRYIEAFEHAIAAENPMGAAGILDTQIDTLFDLGQARTVRAMAARLPRHIQAYYPKIMLAMAWPAAMQWKFAEAARMIDASRARIDELVRLGATAEGALERMRRLVAHRELILAQCRDEPLKMESLARGLLRNFHDASAFEIGSIHSAYAVARREQFKLDDFEHLDAVAADHMARCASPMPGIAHDAVAGHTLLLTGDPETAIRRLRGALATTQRILGPQEGLCAMTALPLAEALYERNELKEARSLIETYLPMCDGVGFAEQLVSGWITHARLLDRRGEHEEALHELSRAGALAARTGFTRLGIAAAEERMWQLLRAGRSEDAGRVARQAGLHTSPAAAMPAGSVTAQDESRALMWVAWAGMQKRHSEALEVARQWRGFCDAAGAVRATIRWDLRVAHLHLANGDMRSAKRALRHAITRAAPGRYLRSLLDEPLLLGSLLGEAPAAEPRDSTAPFFALLMRLHRSEHGSPTPVTAEPEPSNQTFAAALCAREAEILKLIASGLSNREVGDWLGMTEGTIKWHLQQIYNKMGTRRRLLAVERARHLGLID